MNRGKRGLNLTGAVLLALALALSGCSLLFVAKGGTRTGKGKEAPTPVAEDLTREINEPGIVTFTTRPERNLRHGFRAFFWGYGPRPAKSPRGTIYPLKES